MSVIPFNKDPRVGNGEAYATEFHAMNHGSGETFICFAFVRMSWSGDCASIDRGYATMVDAVTAAYQQAKCRNTVFIPSNEGGK